MDRRQFCLEVILTMPRLGEPVYRTEAPACIFSSLKGLNEVSPDIDFLLGHDFSTRRTSGRANRCIAGPSLWVGFGLSFHLFYSATSMRKPAANSPTAPIQTSAFPKDESQRLFISSRYRTSQLVEAFKPFGELAFPNAPLAADFESRQFLVLDHAVHCSLRHLQQLSGFLKRQQA